MKKRLLALALCLSMLISMVPVSMAATAPDTMVVVVGDTQTWTYSVGFLKSLTAESSDSSVVSVSTSSSGSFTKTYTVTVTALKAGDATITVNNAGTTTTTAVTVYAAEDTVDWKFKEVGATYNGNNDGTTSFKTATAFQDSYDASQCVDGSAPWMYVSANNTFQSTTDVYGTFFFGNQSGGYDTVVLRVRIDEDAEYLPGNIHYTYATGSTPTDVYLAPISDPENKTDESYYLTRITDSTTAETVAEAGTDTVMIKAGEYYMTFRNAVAGSEEDRYLCLHNFRLFNVGEYREVFSNVTIESTSSTIRPSSEGEQLRLVGHTRDGRKIDVTEYATGWDSSDTDVLTVSDSGLAVPQALGRATVTATVTYDGNSYTATRDYAVHAGKTRSTYYTEERMNAMQANIAIYDWAAQTKTAYVNAADALISKVGDADAYLEFAYTHLLPSQQIPRAATIGYRLDPLAYNCPICNVDIRKEYGLYGWVHDPYKNPWKIQCPDCGSLFPSNDFKSFYEAGLDEHGFFNYEKALQDGQEFLVNELYPDMPDDWMVDDSRGYKTGEYYDFTLSSTVNNNFGLSVPSQFERTYNFIAYYAHWALYSASSKGQAYTALNYMTNAYIYSQDLKYGRIAAVMLDRMADLYPEMCVKPWFPYLFNSDSTTPLGKHVGCIWQQGINRQMLLSYDALFKLYDNEEVISYLSAKAAELGLDEDYTVPDYMSGTYDVNGYQDANYVEPTVTKQGNPKTSGDLIRQHIETNIIAETAEDLYSGQVHGNFGMHQSLAAYTAAIWDTQPYTDELIAWMNRPSDDAAVSAAQTGVISGANFDRTVYHRVSRDGTGTEAAPNYNTIWVPAAIVEPLANYPEYSAEALLQHPKILMMYKQNIPLTLLRRETAAIGDSGAVTNNTLMGVSGLKEAFMVSHDPELGQWLYWQNGNTTDGMYSSIFDENPTEIADLIDEIIRNYGELDLDKSEQMTGFGFSINRGGTKTAAKDNQRYNYLYYGRTSGHGHPAALDFEMAAFGMKITADLGYPEAADGGYKNTYWGKATINHNVVMVDAARQSYIDVGYPLHFDDSERVKLIDVEAPQAYAATDEYRRTVMMVEVDEDNAYSVDFFRVKGGDDHIYSFHALSNNVTDSTLNMTEQASGTYAGEDVEVGGQQGTGIVNAFDFLYDVRRDSNPGSTFQMNFAIDDIQNVGNSDVSLKMTMLNDFDLTEVALAKGEPPQRDDNPEELEFVLARRTGDNLDSLFTTVFEPYNGESYIQSQETVDVTVVSGTEGANDVAKAVKVTLKSGRVDYIVYATNNEVLYKVDGLFDFQGFAGVYTLEDGQPTYSYINDGTVIGDSAATAAYTGTVTDFQKEAVLDNYITVSFDGEYDLSSLAGQYIYVENDGVDNAVYEILGAETLANGDVKLDVGTLSTIRGMVDEYDLSAGLTYSMGEGDAFAIPLAASEEYAAETATSGTCGESATWSYADGVLTISGTGAMDYYTASEHAPWYPLRGEITSIVIEKGITSIGSYAFRYCSAAASVTIPVSVKTIGAAAFDNADALTDVYYGSTETIWARVKIGANNAPLTDATLHTQLPGLAQLSTVAGAQIRTTGRQGLRFISSIVKDDAFDCVTEYGTLLIPSDDLTDISELQIGATLNGHKVAKVPAKALYEETDSQITFTAVLINVPVAQYTRSITARAYAIMEDGTVVYGDSYADRSIYQVATLGLEDANADPADKQVFLDLILAVDNENGTLYPW